MKGKSKKYFCFPKSQRLMILYSHPTVFEEDLFQSLSIQMSPKNSKLFRLRKSKAGHFLSTFLQNSIIINDLPTKDACIGYQSKDKLILFKQEQNSYSVWSKESNSTKWKKESFLGLPLIYKYETRHIYDRMPLIELTLSMHWDKLKNQGEDIIHGDFTHFNILIDTNKSINYIDKKTSSKNILFDHFYFYNYLIQCLTLCETISRQNINVIKQDIESILVNLNIHKLDNFEQLVQNIKLEECWGLKPRFKEAAKQKFLNLFL